ncbi:hypothetical protein HDU99_001448 [Rhizoclosmatium hyalinum]|nr:hypothetical protein HDU99_001448 [Rhizoclosmatium hyalinum]
MSQKKCPVKDIVQYQCEVMRLAEGQSVEAIEGVVTSRQHQAVWNCKPLLRKFRQCVGEPTEEITFKYDLY